MVVRIEDFSGYRGEIRAMVFDGDLSSDRLEEVLADRSQPEWARLAQERSTKNIVTNVGRQQMTKLIVAETTATAGYIGLSTSVIAPALADTALPNEINRAAMTIAQSFNTYTQRYVALFTTVSFTSTGVNAEGLFDTATTGGNMWADGTISVSKTTTQALVVEHRITATT